MCDLKTENLQNMEHERMQLVEECVKAVFDAGADLETGLLAFGDKLDPETIVLAYKDCHPIYEGALLAAADELHGLYSDHPSEVKKGIENGRMEKEIRETIKREAFRLDDDPDDGMNTDPPMPWEDDWE